MHLRLRRTHAMDDFKSLLFVLSVSIVEVKRELTHYRWVETSALNQGISLSLWPQMTSDKHTRVQTSLKRWIWLLQLVHVELKTKPLWPIVGGTCSRICSTSSMKFSWDGTRKDVSFCTWLHHWRNGEVNIRLPLPSVETRGCWSLFPKCLASPYSKIFWIRTRTWAREHLLSHYDTAWSRFVHIIKHF